MIAWYVAGGVLLARPGIAVAQGGACVDGVANNSWSGGHKDPSGGASTWVSGIIGVHYTSGSTYFYACSLNNPGNDGPSTWIAIEPGSGSSQYNNFNAILQIGFIRCSSIAYSTCDNGVPHLFWGRGGCGANFPVPFDLGATVHGTHSYEISLSGSTYSLKENGVTRATILKTDGAIGCWTNQDTLADWSVERLDHGDSAGSNGNTSQRTQMTQFLYMMSPSNWLSPNLGSCYNTSPSGTGHYSCTSGSNWVHVWTTY
jgi:hypothetical protein